MSNGVFYKFVFGIVLATGLYIGGMNKIMQLYTNILKN
jgi:hypothetical protein